MNIKYWKLNIEHCVKYLHHETTKNKLNEAVRCGYSWLVTELLNQIKGSPHVVIVTFVVTAFRHGGDAFQTLGSILVH